MCWNLFVVYVFMQRLILMFVFLNKLYNYYTLQIVYPLQTKKDEYINYFIHLQ